uniref:Cytochrome P450 n=1 Tax=Araucaria cunninghamii TaxID=56994 RepID=A0A0D6QTS8_ARACU
MSGFAGFLPPQYLGMMSSSTLWVSLVVLMATIILVLMHLRSRHSRRGLPPGPWGLPVIGNLHMLGSLPHQSLSNLAKKYGPLMYLRLGCIDTIVVSSPHMAAQVLQKQGGVFINRGKTLATEILAYNSCSIAFCPGDEYWREARRMAVSLIFTPKMLELFQSVRREEALEVVKSIWEASREQSKAISINPYVLNFTVNNMSRMAFGKRYVESSHEFNKLLFDIFELFGAFNIGDYIPWLEWLDVQGYHKRMVDTRKRLDDLMERIVKDHMDENLKSPKDESKKDLVDLLLTAAQNLDSKVQFTIDNIKAIGTDMFNGGVESVIVLVEWAMAELIKNPKSMNKLQQELDIVVGKDRQVDEADLPNLKYLKCIIKETIRLHPSVPLIPRESVEECIIDTYRIPPKTKCLVNFWSFGRDPLVWENPLEFLPERFENSDINSYGQYMEYIPGGAGRRICPGLLLGITMIEVVLASLVHSFNWNLPPPLQPNTLDMFETFGLSLPKKKPLLLVATPRLDYHIY